MSELQSRLEKLMLRLDHMGMRVEQALIDAVGAIRAGNVSAGKAVDAGDSHIDREEVQIEQECVRLLALYQPAAIDLRTICTVIKVNNDLERIADLAASVGRRVEHVVRDGVSVARYADCERLIELTVDILGRTVRMISATDLKIAHNVIRADAELDDAYKRVVQSVLDTEDRRLGGADTAMTMINLAKALERIGDLCTNIAEDVIFQRTGDIVRHADAFESPLP